MSNLKSTVTITTSIVYNHRHRHRIRQEISIMIVMFDVYDKIDVEPIAGDGTKVQMSVGMNSLLRAHSTLAKNLKIYIYQCCLKGFIDDSHFLIIFHLKTLLTTVTLRTPRDLPHCQIFAQWGHFIVCFFLLLFFNCLLAFLFLVSAVLQLSLCQLFGFLEELWISLFAIAQTRHSTAADLAISFFFISKCHTSQASRGSCVN